MPGRDAPERRRRVRAELIRMLGESRFLDGPEDTAAYAYDASGLHDSPWGVAFPVSPEEIGGILKLARKEGFCVVPRGAGTGMTGGAVPPPCAVVLVLTRMNRILEVDEENMVAVVEPGVITGRLQEYVEAKGLFYPPDPASLHVSTIGGNVAECAGGARAFKYGVTRDYVLGLEAVLPSGECIRTGVRTRKGVVGYDLTRLLVGSEGTLAVITKIVLKLIPLPPCRRTLAVSFRRLEDAAETIRDIVASRIVPSVLEIMDGASIACVEEQMEFNLYKGAEALIFVELDGQERDVEIQMRRLREILRKHDARSTRIARDPGETEEMWRFRRSISPSLYVYAPHKISEDIVVPLDKVPEMIRRIAAMGREAGLLVTTFGHAGDGNLHVNVMLDKRDPDQAERAEFLVSRIFAETLRLGGTLSGEHGIGLTKAPFIEWEVGEPVLALMEGIKRVFDPWGILNPGKVLARESRDRLLGRIFRMEKSAPRNRC